jgi:serine/threonine protein kinase
MEIIKSQNYSIYKLDNSIFKIKFHYSAYELVNSIIKSKTIKGSSTDETYKTITFKAKTVKTMKQYLHDYESITGKKGLLIPDAIKILNTLTTQLTVLLEKNFSTILGYNPREIIMINDETPAFLGSEFVANFDIETNLAMICCPFSPNDFFFSPEMLSIKELPSYVHYKTSYFSLACLIIYLLLGDNEFYKDYLNHKQCNKIMDVLNNHPIKDTKLYWLLSRCLVEDSKIRSIIFI